MFMFVFIRIQWRFDSFSVHHHYGYFVVPETQNCTVISPVFFWYGCTIYIVQFNFTTHYSYGFIFPLSIALLAIWHFFLFWHLAYVSCLVFTLAEWFNKTEMCLFSVFIDFYWFGSHKFEFDEWCAMGSMNSSSDVTYVINTFWFNIHTREYCIQLLKKIVLCLKWNHQKQMTHINDQP